MRDFIGTTIGAFKGDTRLLIMAHKAKWEMKRTLGLKRDKRFEV